MDIVIVRYENQKWNCLAQLPSGGYHLGVGDLVEIKTEESNVRATCLCDSFSVNDDREIDAVCKALNALKPLPFVVGRYTYFDFDVDNAQLVSEGSS